MQNDLKMDTINFQTKHNSINSVISYVKICVYIIILPSYKVDNILT